MAAHIVVIAAIISRLVRFFSYDEIGNWSWLAELLALLQYLLSGKFYERGIRLFLCKCHLTRLQCTKLVHNGQILYISKMWEIHPISQNINFFYLRRGIARNFGNLQVKVKRFHENVERCCLPFKKKAWCFRVRKSATIMPKAGTQNPELFNKIVIQTSPEYSIKLFIHKKWGKLFKIPKWGQNMASESSWGPCIGKRPPEMD